MDPIYTAGWIKDYMEHRFPLVPGIDVSGVIEGIGSGVEGRAVGDEVYGVAAKSFVGAGTFAEYVTVPSTAVARKPRSLSHANAAAVPERNVLRVNAIVSPDPDWAF